MKNLAEKVYKKTADFLDKPLSEHMSFRPLSYYYSYKFGAVTHNPFRLVESGMLVDLAV
jgi:hypothetical protein